MVQKRVIVPLIKVTNSYVSKGIVFTSQRRPKSMWRVGDFLPCPWPMPVEIVKVFIWLALPQEAAGLKTTDHAANGQACCLETLMSCANQGLIRGW